MVTITAWDDADRLTIMGHGLIVEDDYPFAEGVMVVPEIPMLDLKALAKRRSLKEQAAITTMHEIASFAIEVVDPRGGKHLANRGWNRLWDFHLLSLAAKSPAFILYSASSGIAGTAYAVANRNLILSPLEKLCPLTPANLQWAKNNEPNFRRLISDPQFSAAMRYFGNAHYLFDLQHRIMLLWAGIEGLLQVEAEHNHRIALYSAILSHGTEEERLQKFEAVRKAYSLRSRVVHGALPKEDKLKKGYSDATDLLASLLARCVELGRVPTKEELDKAVMKAELE